MSLTPRLPSAFVWACTTCQRSHAHPTAAAACHPDPRAKRPKVAAPLVRWNELPMWDGHPLALTGWLEADQAELTVLHRPEDDDALKVTAYRFCASRGALEPTGSFAVVPA